MSRPTAREALEVAVQLADLAPVGHPLRAEVAELVARLAEPGGRAPYGWRWERGELVEVPRAQKVIRAMRKWHGEGHSPKAIAQALNSLGDVPAPSGGRWYGSSVENILRRAEAAGE